MPFTAGTQVGPYRILEQLGQGGMATVYKAYHASLDRYVAIKALHPAFMEDPNFLARFQREARVVARLEHPNIVPIYDYAEHEGQPYLVMKYIEGETLKARLQAGPLNAAEVSYIVETVGAALAYAHKQGILHRDIKPSNVILANDGQVYLADFGLARIAQSGESTLTSDMVLGTPQYISPEQAMAKKDLDEGTDIYSFGVMLYEMTVGRVPFSGDTPFSVIHDHIYTPLPLPSSVNANVPPELERFLLKALAKERADRFKDVPEMLQAFQEAWKEDAAAVLAKTAVSPSEAVTVPPTVSVSPSPASEKTGSVTPPPAVPTPPVAQTKKPGTIPPWIWAAAALGLCLLCCLVAFLVWRAQNRRAVPRLTETPHATVVAVPSRETSPTLTIPAPVGETALPSTALPDTTPLEKAKQQAEQNPNDPKAHLVYGRALIKDGQAKTGYQEIKQAAALMGKNQALLITSAKNLEDDDLWLGGAILYLQAVQNSRLMPVALTNSLHEAVYYGFEEQYAPQVLDYAEIAKVDPALALVAQAHYTFMNLDDQALVQRLIDQLDTLKPGLQDTKLLKADLLIDQGNNTEAKAILQGLLGAPDNPAWVNDEAKLLLGEIK